MEKIIYYIYMSITNLHRTKSFKNPVGCGLLTQQNRVVIIIICAYSVIIIPGCTRVADRLEVYSPSINNRDFA